MSRLLREPGVSDLTGFKTTAIYARIKQGLLVPPIKAGRASLWPSDEVQIVNEAIIGGASDEQIRELVTRLVTARPARAAQVLKGSR